MANMAIVSGRLKWALLLVSALLFSCGDESSPPCGPFSNYIYNIGSMAANIYEVPDGTDYPAIGRVEFAGSSIALSDLLLVLSAESVTYIAKATSPEFRQGWLIKSANACSPPLPYTDETISDITITSNSDFNDMLPSGTVLNTLFLVEYISEYPSLPTTLHELWPAPESLLDYVSRSPKSVAHLGLRLVEVPTSSPSHTFTITYTQSSGETFEMTTPEITFE
ncbi:MAG: hypothetical protein PVF82_09460 [Gammaproteobacteria bacterium]|jgi:hypothetical protein